MNTIPPLESLAPGRFDDPVILKRPATASRQLAELKGVAGSIPHQGILINTLGMQEAKDSSAIENIVTTHDELFKDDAFPETAAIEFIERDLRASRITATKYLEALTQTGFLHKQKIGRSNYYINIALNEILTSEPMQGAFA